MATNHATTPISFPPPSLTERIYGLDHHEKDHLERLLNRRDTFGVSISDDSRLGRALTEITWTLNHWPKYFSVTKDELLAITNGEEHNLFTDIPIWFEEFLPSLNAWHDITLSIFRIETYREYDREALPCLPEKIKDWHEKLSVLLAEVMEAYAPADRELLHFANEDGENPAASELLKRYYRYTCAVCDFAKELWPSANLERLLQQV